MVRKCCVPWCTTNFSAKTAGSCFRFPSDEQRREEWIKAIPRDDAFNTNHSGVCILHFERKFIVTRSKLGLLLKTPRLTNLALPTVFNFAVNGIPDMFTYDPEVIEKIDDGNNDLIRNFANLKDNYSNHISVQGWLTTASETHLTFYKLKRKPDNNLIVELYVIQKIARNSDSH